MGTMAYEELNRKIDADTKKIYDDIASKCADSFTDEIGDDLKRIIGAAEKLSEASSNFAESESELAKLSEKLNNSLNNVSGASSLAKETAAALKDITGDAEKCRDDIHSITGKLDVMSSELNKIIDETTEKAHSISEEFDTGAKKVCESLNGMQTDFKTAAENLSATVEHSRNTVVKSVESWSAQIDDSKSNLYEEAKTASQEIKSVGANVTSQMNSALSDIKQNSENLLQKISGYGDKLDKSANDISNAFSNLTTKLDKDSEQACQNLSSEIQKFIDRLNFKSDEVNKAIGENISDIKNALESVKKQMNNSGEQIATSTAEYTELLKIVNKNLSDINEYYYENKDILQKISQGIKTIEENQQNNMLASNKKTMLSFAILTIIGVAIIVLQIIGIFV